MRSLTAADRAALAGRVQQAIAGGAWSWAEVARRAGCSRTWARRLATERGWELAEAGARDVRLSVRLRSAVARQVEAEAAREGVPRSEMHRRLLSEALRARGTS